MYVQQGLSKKKEVYQTTNSKGKTVMKYAQSLTAPGILGNWVMVVNVTGSRILASL